MTRSVEVRVGIVVTLLVALVAVGGQPTGAVSSALQSADYVVGSSHSSAQELSNAQTLTNLTTSGSGDSASLGLTGGANETVDSFEDGDMAEYTGDTASWTAQTTTVLDGSYAAEGASGGTARIRSTSGLPTYPSVGDPLSARVQVSSGAVGGISFGVQDSSNYYEIHVNANSDVFAIVEEQAGSYAHQKQVSTPVPANEWTQVKVDWELSGGDVVITARLYNADGTELASISWTDTTSPFTSGGVGMVQSLGGTVYVDDFKMIGTGSPASAAYVSALHNVSNAEQAAINITEASDVSVDAEVRTTSGTVLGSTSLSSTGNHTLNLSNTSSSQLETVLNVTATGNNPQFELSDESILFTNHAPEASAFTPSDGAQLTEQETTFSVQVNDSEFSTAQSDEVRATLFVEGEQSYQTNVTSNQTVSTTENFSIGGTVEYYWTLEDSYGANTTTDVRTVSTPSQLTIYEERNAETRVTADGNATVTIYGTDQVYERQADNGTVDLVDLPIDEPLYVRANIPGYYSRTVFLESLYEQQRMYVLSENATSTENRFTLEETPGYPEDDTILRIQRPLSLNNTTTWQTIVGSEFGVNGFTVNLEEGVRYRLQLVGPNDNVASLGGYTATVSETVPLAPSRPSIASSPSDAPVLYDVQRKNGSLILGYQDNDDRTSSVKVYIYERGNESNLLEPNSTYTNTQEIAYSIDLSNQTVNQSWVVEYHVEFEDGSSEVFRALAGSSGTITVPVELGAMWQQIIIGGLIVLFAGAFSVFNRSEGAFAVALVGGVFLYIGWLDGITTGPAVSVAIGIGVYSMLNNET